MSTRMRLERQYRDALVRYSEDPGEVTLAAAYELGRAALADGLGILEVAAMHRDATVALVDRRPSSEARQTAMTAVAFLLECLGPFEMALRGFNEAIASLQSMNSRLESLVQTRTRELGDSLDRLRVTDLRRRELLASLVRSQEEERSLFAHALHDDTIQLMTAVMMRLSLVRTEPTDPEALQHVRESEDTLGQAIRRCRLLLFELLPRSLEHDGLIVAVHELLRRSSEDGGFTHELDDRLRDRLPHEVEAVTFRVVQEAVANIRKHAHARHVEVLIDRAANLAHIRIVDDGSGFDSEAISESIPGHLGLTAMRDRVESTGGRIEVRGREGVGTTVEAWIPIDVPSESSAEVSAARESV